MGGYTKNLQLYKADTLEDAVKLAAEIIDSGKAKARLDEFIKLSNQE